MMRSIVIVSALLGITCAMEAAGGLRDWTNMDGKTITAELVELNGGVATLKMENGRTYEVSLSTLSESDSEFAASWAEEQEAAAKRGEMKTELAVVTEAIVETAFNEETPRTRKGEISGWQAGIGEWRIEEGALIGDELPEDNHASSLTYRLEADHLIISAQVRLGTAENIAFACRDTVPPNLHLGRLYISPDKLWIQSMSGIAKTTTSEKLVTIDVDLDPEEWYDVTIEIIGDQYRATVGGEEIEATHSRFADAKGIVALVNKGQGASYRNLSLWHAEPNE